MLFFIPRAHLAVISHGEKLWHLEIERRHRAMVSHLRCELLIAYGGWRGGDNEQGAGQLIELLSTFAVCHAIDLIHFPQILLRLAA